MKNLLCFFATLISLSSPVAFANTLGKTASNETLVYCPPQIVCTEAKNPSSCKYDSTYARYWDHIGGSGTGDDPHVAGTYVLRNIVAGYHWPSDAGRAVCIYSTTYTGKEESIALYAKSESNIEAKYDKATTKWDASQPYPNLLSCSTNLPTYCPLREAPSIAIRQDQSIKEQLYVMINGVRISNLPISNSNIRYEDALPGCSSSSQCKIDLATEEYMIIGSIIVDMSNMKLLKIIPTPTSLFNIKQVDSFNTIKVTRSDPPPVIYSISVHNYINSDVTALTNNKPLIKGSISTGKYDSVFSDRAMASCQEVKKCKIDLKTSKGGMLGYVVVDVENKMNILEVNSFQPSQIVITNIDTNKIEIKYYNTLQ